MKINTLLSMAKKRKNCKIFWDDEHNRQWMQLGGDLYPLDGMPYLDKETLLIMMDVPEDKRDDYWIECQRLPDKLLALVHDNADDDQPARRAYLTITPFLQELRPVYICEEEEKTLVLVPENSFKPIADEAEEYLLFARQHEGHTYILAKKGFELIAVIARVVVNDEQTEGTLQNVLCHIRADIDRIKAEGTRKHGEQQHI